VDLGILGPLEVRSGDDKIEIRHGHARALLAALVLRAGETVTADALVDLLWGDDFPQNPANALQVQISYLRRTLEQGCGTQPIVTRAGGYSLDVAHDRIDTHRFEALVRDARSAIAEGRDLTGVLDLVDRALGLWRGEALADLPLDAFRGDATRLTELRWETIEARNEVLLALGRHHEAVGDLVRLTDEQPLRERWHEQLVLALYRAGRQADALRAFDKARSLLVEELGIEPGERLQNLHAQVLAQDRTLDAAAHASDPATPPPATPAPAPAAALVRPRSAAVPVPVTATLGRGAEIARLTDLLGRQRLVTLTGPAGAGKSRLAIEIARAAEAQGRVVYVDLGALDSPHLVAAAVASALGVSAPPDEDVIDLVAAHVAEQPTMVVLDTCEHVLDGASGLASRIVRTSASSRVLATSRRPLGIAGEIAWPVPPLALAPPEAGNAASIRRSAAAQLFVERAAAVRPGFDLTDTNAPDIAAICLAVDGLPLAIELAAARADILTPAAIRGRLEDRFALLVDGSVDGAPRQQTLRAALDWSYELLDEPQRDLLTRLSVFPAPFDLDAATAIGATGADVVDLLTALVRHSVVMVAGDDRYRLLDSIRAYAAEKLRDPESARRLHAIHYTDVAETSAPHLYGPEQVEWLARMRTDIPHFRTALAWASTNGDDEIAARLAAAVAWLWTVEGLLSEAVTMMERAVEIDAAPPATRSRIRAGYGLLVASLGRLEDARRVGQEAVEIARTTDHDATLADALNTLAVARWALGDLAGAAESHDEAIDRYEAAGHRWGIGLTRTLRTRTAIDAGEPDVDDRARDALDSARRGGDRHIIAIALDQLARLDLARGDPRGALRLAEECVGLQQEVGYTEGVVASLHLLGRIQLAAGEVDEADRVQRRALALATSIGHAAATCEAVDELARIALARGRPGDTIRYLDATDAERHHRGIARRPVDADEIARARRDAAVGVPGASPPASPSRASLDDIVSELLAEK